MLYQLSYASTLKPGKDSRTLGRIASIVRARRGPPLWIILTTPPQRYWLAPYLLGRFRKYGGPSRTVFYVGIAAGASLTI
jgi:hypothetical protein